MQILPFLSFVYIFKNSEATKLELSQRQKILLIINIGGPFVYHFDNITFLYKICLLSFFGKDNMKYCKHSMCQRKCLSTIRFSISMPTILIISSIIKCLSDHICETIFVVWFLRYFVICQPLFHEQTTAIPDISTILV